MVGRRDVRVAFVAPEQWTILLDGDPVPWDSMTGGALVYDHPSWEHPYGRTYRELVTVTRGNVSRTVPYGRITAYLEDPRV